jgi:hypothetical protein
MTTAALVIMVVSVGFVVWLTAWCFWKVLTTPAPPNTADPDDR